MPFSPTGLFAAGVAVSMGLALAVEARPAGQSAGSPGVTFNKDIAPLLWQNCATCHRPDQVAPFSLVTFNEVRPRAREIARVVRSRRMPPWKPEPGHGDFAGVRRLTDAQIALINQWIAAGSPEGHSRDLPTRPAWTPGWYLGEPDLIVTMPDPYELAPQRSDVFRSFVIPIPLNTRRYVRAMEFQPGAAKVVHHANIKIDRSRFSRQWDEREPGPGYHGGGSREAIFPDGHFLGWTPGQSPRISPPDMAWRLEPDSDLVIEMHLMPGGTTEKVQASVGLFFTNESPTKTAYMLRLGKQDIDIAAGRRDYISEDSYTLPVDVEVLGVQPHAHYLAKEVRGSATLPDGAVKPLIYIKDWDFHWQDMYVLASPLRLPKGTIVSMRYTYDNSAANPRNPSRPPRRVTFGQTSASEMGSLWLQVLPGSPTDLRTLDEDFSPKLLADDIAGNEKWLEMNPRDAQIHAELAMCYYEAGRHTEALEHLTEAARLEPDAGRHYDIGRLHLMLRQFVEAAATFNRVLSMNPRHAEASYGLGVALDGLGRLDGAVAAYTKALELNLEYADAHFNLARVLTAQKKYDEAIKHYRQALQLNPQDTEARAAIESLKVLQK
jgi:mono/diheme cytochrome c family protein